MIRISTIRSLSLGLLLLGGLPLAAREWWVSPTGDDGSAGTKGAPWGTLAKANGEVQAGDTVTLLAG
ncbi:MAG: pectate lyase, partial [Victivallales bacterium]|nr:pectate lyase [Victivallales bacterium]